MPVIQFTIEARLDGTPVPGFPLTRLFTVDEVQQFAYDKAPDGDSTTFTALPVSQVTTVQVLGLLAATHPVGVRLEGGEAGTVAVRLSAAGGVLVWGVSLLDTNLTVNNAGASTAKLFGFGGGT